MTFTPTNESNLRITYSEGKYLLEQVRIISRMGRSDRYPDALADTPEIGSEDWLTIREYLSLNECLADTVVLMAENNRQLRDVYLSGVSALELQRGLALLAQVQL